MVVRLLTRLRVPTVAQPQLPEPIALPRSPREAEVPEQPGVTSHQALDWLNQPVAEQPLPVVVVVTPKFLLE